MQRIEIVKEISAKTGIEKEVVESILSSLLLLVEERMINNEYVSLSRFGRFSTKKRAAKMGRNISNNTPIRIPPCTALVFKPSTAFIQSVKKLTPENN